MPKSELTWQQRLFELVGKSPHCGVPRWEELTRTPIRDMKPTVEVGEVYWLVCRDQIIKVNTLDTSKMAKHHSS